MSVKIAEGQFHQRIQDSGNALVVASINSLSNECQITPLTSAHVLLQQALRALNILGGDDAARYAIATARRLQAEASGNRAAARKAAEQEMAAFERMAAVYDAQLERMEAGGLQ